MVPTFVHSLVSLPTRLLAAAPVPMRTCERPMADGYALPDTMADRLAVAPLTARQIAWGWNRQVFAADLSPVARRALVRGQAPVHTVHDRLRRGLTELGVPHRIVRTQHHGGELRVPIEGAPKRFDVACAWTDPDGVTDFGSGLYLTVRTFGSSVTKNMKTTPDTFDSEASRLHQLYPEAVIGCVTLMPLYDIAKDKVVSYSSIAAYAHRMRALQGRVDATGPVHHREAATLVLVDNRPGSPCRFPHTRAHFARLGMGEELVDALADLDVTTFLPRLVAIHRARHARHWMPVGAVDHPR